MEEKKPKKWNYMNDLVPKEEEETVLECPANERDRKIKILWCK